MTAWLQQLGLERYASLFAENDIDLEVLKILTDQDLQDLGVSFGHRKKLLKAVSEKDSQPAVTLVIAAAAPSPAASQIASSAQPAGADAQRRHITVMFCDLVGSTALSQTLDPEDLRDVMRNYQEAARRVVLRHQGHIAQYLGDGLMVYFGWPHALGSEAQRAIRCGMEFIEATRRLQAPVELAVRVGIATGLVVIGDTTDGEPASQMAVGETPNVAARLQGLARPNTVVVSELTKRLAESSFSWQDLGELALKGIAEGVHGWTIAGVRNDDGEHDSIARPTMPLLVGRDEEIGLLRRAWQQSKEGHGQVVLISGEPGIGKSVLVEVLSAQLRAEGVLRVIARGSPYYTNSALYPLIEHMKKVVAWQPDAAPEQNLENVERTLGACNLPLERFVPPLASLLSLPLPPARYAPLALRPAELKQRIFDDLIEWQLLETERQPVLMVWEDLHWCDPSTLEYLGQLIEQAPTAALCLVLTFRPEFTPPWPSHSHQTPISLNRLERPQIEVLIKQLAKGKGLPQPVIDHVVRKTDGVPLYVEELTKAILGSSILRETAERYEQTGPLSAVAIPATLHESLMARLDRLPSAREVAQLGAVLGREFAYEVMQALGHGDESTLRDGLSQLVAGELLYQRGRPPRAKYIFKHALIQDAAYQSLLKRTRRRYHYEVAQLLEKRFPQQVETEPELLAYHYTGAQMAAEAIPYWLKAAKHAASRSAYREALAQLQSGKALLEGLPAGRERVRLELQLEMERAVALNATKGMAAAETAEAFSAVHEFCRQLGGEVDDIYLRASSALGISAIVRAEWARASEIGRELLERAEALDDETSVMAAHRLIGFTGFFSGNFISGRHHLEQAASLYNYEKHHTIAAVAGQDPGVGSLAILSWILLPLGFPDSALARAREAIDLAAKLKHAHSHAYALHYASVVYLERGEYKLAFQESEADIALSNEFGFPIWLALSRIIKGEALAQLGSPEEGLIELRRGITEFQSTGTQTSLPSHFLGLARALRCAKRHNDALDAVHEGLDTVERNGERRAEAELHRVKGELLSELSFDRAEAEACFHRALEIARAQSTKLWELRAATSLVQLWRERGETRQAHELLAPLYNWFKEGLDTRDMKTARALLEM
jgi:predicted ATPase/class 3 adenylate cyclase